LKKRNRNVILSRLPHKKTKNKRVRFNIHIRKYIHE
jgi:hypothetical protein